MKEIKTFQYKIIIKFSELNQELENSIYKKLVDTDFLTDFEVINILSFTVKEMFVNGLIVICKLDVISECNCPTIGKILEISDFIEHGDSIIYRSGRIQIISEKPINYIRGNMYKIKIEDKKVISRNILCVGAIV